MTTFIDTSTIFAALREEEPHHEWAVEQIDAARAEGALFIPDLVFAELCYDQNQVGDVLAIIEELEIERVGHTPEALFLASKVFRRYRENGGTKLTMLPDFLIGAVARTEQAPLLTANEDDFLKYFEGLEVICPSGRHVAEPERPAPRGRRR
ncbi:DNA-binding protein [Aureimonas endophytica]|uniref:DNA-binding protein n=1 Tax=Aureimonas endophytica TaxID=2027858 RepID=A0A916ZIY5_9HYPH|nr:PIN domain-containing protein [Aureimonas endophytica]GGE00211.1 DNA-binding protein [Aureimonas endophytica]